MQPQVVPSGAVLTGAVGAAPARAPLVPAPRAATRPARRWWPRSRASRREASAAVEAAEAARTAWTGALAVLDASTDPVLGVDADGITVFGNAAAAVLVGRPRAELAGLPAGDLVAGLPAAVRAARGRVLEGLPVDATGDGLDLVVAGPDGDVPVTGWLTPLLRPGGDLVVAVTLHDDRARRALDDRCGRLDEEARSARVLLDTVLRAVADRAVVVADADGRISRLNRAAEKLLGCRARDLVGSPTTRLSDPADLAEVARELGVPDGVDPLLELARWGLPNRQDWDFVTADGARRPVSVAVHAVGERETPTAFVCVASDRSVEWQQVPPRRDRQSARPQPAQVGERLLLDLDDAATRVLSWGVGRSGSRQGG